MANHHSQVDVILGTKTDIDKLYNLLKDMPDSFDYSDTVMKSFPGEEGYFDANRITYGNAAKKSAEFKDLYFLSIPSFSFKGLGWNPCFFMETNQINYRWLIHAGFCDEDPSETFWTVRNNEINQQETALTYDEEMMTFLNGKKPLPPDDPRLHVQLSDFVKEGIRLFEMFYNGSEEILK